MDVGVWIFVSVALALLSVGLYKSQRLRYWAGVVGGIVVVGGIAATAFAYVLYSNVRSSWAIGICRAQKCKRWL